MRRRHGDELDAAIRAAVLDLLAEHGPAGVTMEAVAAAAQTSKPVLYRRWPDRAALLRDTLLRIATAAIPHDDTGSYRSDMLAILRGWAALFTGPRGNRASRRRRGRRPRSRADGGVSAGCDRLAQKGNGALLARGIERGDVRPDVPVEIARELGQSVLWHRLLITGDPITDDLVVQLVDEVLVPFVAPRE